MLYRFKSKALLIFFGNEIEMVKGYISHINETNIQHVFLIVQEVYIRELFIKIFFCKKRKAKAMKWIRDVEISSNVKPKLNIKQFNPFL